jgi:hypothetical protein
MILRLSELPALLGPTEYGGKVPARFLYLAPDAAASLLDLDRKAGGLIYTDLFRDAHGQLIAHRAKPDSTQPVGWSAHGYGLSIDLDLSATQIRLKLTYVELVELMGSAGWCCHRRDLDSSGSESWHWNYLGPNAARYLAAAQPVMDHRTWSHPVEMRIQERYGQDFRLSALDIQAALEALKLHAVRDFQAAWGLTVDGVAGPKTQRTLSYVSATTIYEPPAREGLFS